MRVGRIFRAVLIALAISVPPACADGQAPITLKVATRIVPPFVMKTGTNLSGFTIELADAVAAEAGLKFDYFDADTLPALLDAVASGKADLGAAAISITAARAEKFDFSMPIFAAGLQIMTRAGGSETDSIIPSFVAFFTSRPFYELIGALLLLVLVPAPVIWFLERRHAHGSVASAKKRHEIFNSMYWSASTLVGQSAGHPVSWSGRLIAVAWMLVGVTFISYFTASITTALTVHQLQSSIAGLEDLRGKRVATVEGSSSQDYLAARDVAAKRLPDAARALEALVEGRADAVVYDAPILLYYAAHEAAGKVRKVGEVLKPEDYGFLLPLGSRYRKPIDQALLRLHERGEYTRIYDRWFKSGATE